MEIFFVLVETKHSGNIGFAARAIKNFGFSELVLVKPKCSIDKEAYRISMHARDILDRASIYPTLESFIQDKQIDYAIGTTARIGGEKNPLRLAIPIKYLRDIMIPEGSRLAFIFGGEESGLTNEDLAKCDLVVTIPTSEDYPVLNLSHAVAVVAYELSIALETTREFPYRPAAPLERAVLIKNFYKILDVVAPDMQSGKKEIYRRIIKNFVGRVFLTGREVHSLIGFTKLILKNLGESKDRNKSS